MDDLSKLDEMSMAELRGVAAQIDLPERSSYTKKKDLKTAIRTFAEVNERIKETGEEVVAPVGAELEGADGEIVDAEETKDDAPAVVIPDPKPDPKKRVFESPPEVQHYVVTKGIRFQSARGVVDVRPGYVINRGSHDLEALRKYGCEFKPCDPPRNRIDEQKRNRPT